jgi:hypothetical protein
VDWIVNKGLVQQFDLNEATMSICGGTNRGVGDGSYIRNSDIGAERFKAFDLHVNQQGRYLFWILT